MKSFQTYLAAGALAVVAAPAFAQVEELPTYAYDMLAEVTMATTADSTCDKMTARPKKVQNYIVALYTQLAADGIGVNDAATHFQGAFSMAEMGKRETALREKHGVDAEGGDALCTAIRAEADENEALAKLMKIR